MNVCYFTTELIVSLNGCDLLKALKFRGTRIHVVQAPEPEQIGWENLEVSRWMKYLLRLRTFAVAFVLLVVCFAVIVQGSIYKNKSSKQIPDLNLCHSTIPNVFAHKQNSSDYTSVSLLRPSDAQLKYYDGLCTAKVPGTFYAIYGRGNSFSHPIVMYDVSACSGSGTGLCPHATNQSVFCPCLSVTSNQVCNSFECSLPLSNSARSKCVSYAANVIGDCFCYTDLLTRIKTMGATKLFDYIKNAQNDVCYPFLVNYSTSTGIILGATFVTVVLNYLMFFFLEYLTKMERHGSADKREASLMFKVFIFTFFNMGVVVLIAFGYINNLPSEFKIAQIFQGVFSDFTSPWYGIVGSYLVLTFVIQAFCTPFIDFFSYSVVMPCARCFNYQHIRLATIFCITAYFSEVGFIFIFLFSFAVHKTATKSSCSQN